MFPFTCCQQIFSLKELCGVQNPSVNLFIIFLKNLQICNISRSKWTQIFKIVLLYLRIPNHHEGVNIFLSPKDNM